MKYFDFKTSIIFLFGLLFYSCSDTDLINNEHDEEQVESCTSDQGIDTSRGVCEDIVSVNPFFEMEIIGNKRVITSNAIPNHEVGIFGGGTGSLNPNAISEQSETYTIDLNPTESSDFTQLLGANGPQYSFGVLINGIELDPVAAEAFPHQSRTDPNANWEWNLEALNVSIGLDCNNAHVQPSGKYHYHGPPVLFLDELEIDPDVMIIIGYAADGFPIYINSAFQDANDASTAVILMTSSYRLKSGERPGDGESAPCGVYDGVYSADYEYVDGLGTLDEANGRFGVTPEYPDGIYYYVLTDDFPVIPRMFKGTPSVDFRLSE